MAQKKKHERPSAAERLNSSKNSHISLEDKDEHNDMIFALRQEKIKGDIVEMVKDELNHTVEAKKKLVEKNYVNFRFNEFKQ